MSTKPRSRSASLDPVNNTELLAGLWEEAPFARLPSDAPPELEKFVSEIEDPTRVYAIHRASRRHGFQILVEKFITQLRHGCGQIDCVTPTCYSCRRRLAGKAPLRRYNNTSARTLAVYLASQDNPKKALCPNLRCPTDAPPAVNNLIFSTRPPASPHSPLKGHPNSPHQRPSSKEKLVPEPKSPKKTSPSGNRQIVAQDANNHCISCEPKAAKTAPTPSSNHEVHITERPQNKDHRSFAANMFGTVAFKMLEWLTPRGLEAISQHIAQLEAGQQVSLEMEAEVKPSQEMPPSSPDKLTPKSSDNHIDSSASRRRGHRNSVEVDGLAEGFQQGDANTVSKVKTKNHNLPASRTRTASTSRPKRKKSIDPFSPTGVPEESKSAILPPRVNSYHTEKPTRHPKVSGNVIGRGIPEAPAKPAFFEPILPSSPSPIPKADVVEVEDEVKCQNNVDEKHVDVEEPKEKTPDTNQETNNDEHETDPTIDLLNKSLPQSFSHLDLELIDFICNVFEEDGTAEMRSITQLSGPAAFDNGAKNRGPLLSRRQLRKHDSKSNKKQWKDFNEQTLFKVLSDPHDLIRSFMDDEQFYDSQTLWYCFRRLTRVAPSLVLHTLWIAASSLLVPETTKSKARCDGTKRVNGTEAGRLLAICLHALAAMVPNVPDLITVFEMSRIRSNGLPLSGIGSPVRQPTSMCLEYDDAFSNELAMRLARRLFHAIAIRRQSPKLFDRAGHITDVLLNQLDFSDNNLGYIGIFPDQERLLYETRVPITLLDWARAVLLHEWDGKTHFATDSPFAGALSFIETMYDNQDILLMGDLQFRVDYFSERLDSVEIPVEWLSFKSTRRKRHLLDYPFIFSPETRVSFFRAINFARMSRMFEESSSLKTRMNAIIDPGSLITNTHHKMVLQDLLRTASSKYLVLDISRQNAAKDAFDQLWRREKRELLRPLKVHLGEAGGEEGFDSGGVQQEFFRLAISECLDPQYGAFTVDERTRMAWFAPGSLIEEWKFELVGLLMSLAIYNGLTLPVTFPKALYRLLLGETVDDIHHIADGWPDLASGLTKLLDWDEKDGAVEDVFARTYEFSVGTFGINVSREMGREDEPWPKAAAVDGEQVSPHTSNPPDAPLVTRENRDDYVADYIRHLTDVSVRPQFKAFQRGFQACLDNKSLPLLTSPLLQALVEGIQEIDIMELRRYTRYVGWDPSHRSIRDFWSIVKRYDDKMKRRLLEFVTSSDRVPVGGMKNLQFVIQRNGEEEGDGGHLPTAYTCYGTLLLPQYKDKEAMRERLAMALENSQGFGFA